MRKTLKATLLAVAVSVASTSAQSFEIIKEEDYARPATELSALMEPILPLMAAGAGSTATITQIGDSNFATASVEGTGSLAVIGQAGERNRAVQSIQGNNSALLLVQGGTNNNVLQVSNGDNNVQLVGVGGSNNNVGYIQSGDNLGGVLGVSGSNSTVLAFQNQNSANFLMPTNLRGLHNTTVVIVPGRMYVFPNKR